MFGVDVKDDRMNIRISKFADQGINIEWAKNLTFNRPFRL